jgi:hypothetical protein
MFVQIYKKYSAIQDFTAAIALNATYTLTGFHTCNSISEIKEMILSVSTISSINKIAAAGKVSFGYLMAAELSI